MPPYDYTATPRITEALIRETSKIVKAARKSRGLSQRELSELLHINQAMVSRLECGTKGITLFTIVHVLYELGYSLEIKENKK